MHERELFDETLDINSTNNYEISIQVSLDGFSFSLLDSLRNRFVMLREYKLNGRDNGLSSQIREIVTGDEFLGKPYRRQRVVFATERCTLVPANLFDPAIKEDYWAVNHVLPPESVVSNNKLKEPDAFLLFDIRKDLFDTTCNLFPEATLSHHVRPLLFASFVSAGKQEKRYIRLNIEGTFFNIIIIKDGQLEFFNTFSYRNTSDILYFLMNSFEQLAVDGNETLWVSGKITRLDELYSNLLKYVKNIRFSLPVGDFSVSYVFEDIGVHQYTNLFNIVSCA